MTRTLRTLVAASAAALLALTLVSAQPGGGGWRGGDPAMTTEQLLGLLAFHPDIALTDGQLTEVRAALRDSYAEQVELRQALRSGAVDFEEVRQVMTEMRQSMIAAVSGVLTEAQNEDLKGLLAQRGGRRRQDGRRGGRGQR